MTLDGKTVYFLGKLAASNRKEAAERVRAAGGRVAKSLGPSVELLVLGEGEVLSKDWNLWNDQLDEATRDAFESGTLKIVSEAAFWDKYGNRKPSEFRPSASLYTPSMLADLAGLPISTVRRLQRLGLITPVRQVHRLCYFDFESIVPLKIVRSMIDAGMTLPKAVERFQKGQRHFSGRPLDVRIDGDDILFVTAKGPVDQDGQRRFDFVLDHETATEPAPDRPQEPSRLDPLEVLDAVFHPDSEPISFETLCEAAWELETSGNLQGAAELYRAALAAGASSNAIAAQVHFQIAELLYRLGDLGAARERYFTAIELDEAFIEARANLGCVLAELGSDELAAAAFRGALKLHPNYAEVHFHLGMLLRRIGLEEEARQHFAIFLELMPDSPWVEQIEAPPVIIGHENGHENGRSSL